MISDLAVVGEMQRQLGLSTCNEYIVCTIPQLDLERWCLELIATFLGLKKVFFSGMQQGFGIPSLATNLRVFDYPSDKPPTAANTAKMRSAEQALDDFWAKFNEYVLHQSGKSLMELEDGKIIIRDIQRTPKWIEPDKESISANFVENMDVASALAELQLRSESTIDRTQPVAPREKVKTRGSSTLEAQEKSQLRKPEEADHSAGVRDTGIKFNKKAFNTLGAMFGSPAAETLPGEIPWADFKKAMVKIGFSAEKLQGSAWLFRPLGAGLNSIIFHEPHPESKLPMKLARRIARRLNRNLGWTAETFVQDDAVGQDDSKTSAL